MGEVATRRFWDRRAREDAFFFVDNRLTYRRPDERRFWAGGERDLDVLLGALDVSLRPTDRVVEIGCGVGRLTRPIAGCAMEVWALDVSPEMLALARRYNPTLSNVRWVLGDGRTLTGVASGSADVCISHVVFQHIPDPDITLGYVAEMGRVLREGGWAAFQISNDPEVHRAAGIRTRAARRLRALAGRAPRGVDAPRWRGAAVELEPLRAAAAASGLELARVVGEGTQFCLVLGRRAAQPGR